MTRPAVSVILCTYNRAPLLPRAVESVLRQSFADWELVVVDDGSRDGTRRLMQRYRRLDPRIRYHYQSNTGLAGARNTGLRLSTGRFITFLDSDDEYRPEHLSLRVRHLERRPGIDLLHGGAKLIGPKHRRYVVDMTDPSRTIHLRRCHIGGTFFFRRRVLSRVRTFRRLPFAEDFDFYRRAERHFTTERVPWQTYGYHLEPEDRLCDVFTERLMKRRTKQQRSLREA